MIAAIKLKKRILFFLLYSFMVIFVFLAIFTLGIFSFQPDIKQWVYDNWGEIRPNVKNFNFEQFENNLKKDITSLGVFAVTIMVGILICMYSIIQLLTFRKIMKSILPPISLLVIVFSSALVMIAIFSGRSASYVNLPTWLNEIAVGVGLFLVMTGFLGYYAAVKKIKKLLLFYLAILIIMFIIIMCAAFGYFHLSSTFVETIERDWPDIYENLLVKGYNISKIVFMDYIMLNFKFAGLYGLMYGFFVFIAILCTISKIRYINEAAKTK
jgi:Tetraspanin family.